MADSKFNRNMGNFIRMMRESKGLTQADIAARMNISSQNISAYERGERGPSVEWVIRLCEALNVNPEDFFLQLLVNLKPENQSL